MGSNPDAGSTNGKAKQTTSNMDVRERPRISYKEIEICNIFNRPNGCRSIPTIFDILDTRY